MAPLSPLNKYRRKTRYYFAGPTFPDVAFSAVGIVDFIASEKATVPASGVAFDSADTLTIPVPAGTQDGDLMIAFVFAGYSGATLSVPSGWTTWIDHSVTNNGTALYYRVASGEPSNYTWTASSAATTLSGEISTYRNALPGAIAMQSQPDDPPGDLPARIAPSVAGAALFAGLYAAQGSGFPPIEELTASPPLTLSAQHAASGFLGSAWTAVAYEENLDADEIVSGRHMDNAVAGTSQDLHFSAIIRAIDGPAPVIPTLVGSSKASVPASGTVTLNNTLITIPVPSGVQDGDWLFALVTSSAAITGPSGWTMHSANGGNLLQVWRRVANSEPASYTWTTTTGTPRSGCMIAVRGGQLGITTRNPSAGITQAIETQVLGTANANNGTGTMTVPTLTTRAVDGEFWIGFVARVETGNDEDFTTTGTHTLQVQHAATGRSCAISIISNIAKHTTVSGNVFVDAEAAGNRRTAAILLQTI